MDRRRVHSGLFGSIGLHLVIMLIPLTTTVVREFEEIELFVIDEKPVIKKEVIERPKMPTVSKAVDQEVRKEPILPPMPPDTEEESPVNQTVTEPEKEVIEEPQEEPPEKPPEITQPPVVVEAPITFSEPIPEASPKSQSVPLSQTVVPMVQTKTIETTEPTTVPPKTLGAPTELQTSASERSPSALEEVPFGSKVAPRFLRREIPIYPLMARRLGKEGKVLLMLSIDEKGSLLSVDVIEKGGYGFTEAAIEAVRRSTFLPAKKDGKPIASRALLPIRFQLERKGW